MQILIDGALLATVVLVAIRLGPLFIAAPVFSSIQIPVAVRGLFVLALSALFVMGLNISPTFTHLDGGTLILAALSELMIGSILAFGVFATFSAFHVGGRIIDMQIGFGVANLFDPVTRSQSPLLGTLLNLTALMVFFAADGHHLLLRGIAFSLEKAPPGQLFSTPDLSTLVTHFSAMFALGVALVVPVMLTLLLVDIGLAAISRTMPQVNVFFVSMPLKVFVGLTLLAVSAHYMPPVMKKAFAALFDFWQAVLE
jgi:flagellar biosynthetic protein FliR